MTAESRTSSAFAPGIEWRLPLIGTAIFALLAALYAFDPPAYRAILTWWSGRPFETPFIDLHGVLSAHDCWRRGFDVYVDNPCDRLHRVFIYSPLWLRLDILPEAREAVPWLGVAQTLAFLAALAALPKLRRGYTWVALGVFGSLPMFALERSNIDVLMVVLAIASATLLSRGPCVRAVGYGLIGLAAALKFYPVFGFALALQERAKAAGAIMLAVAVAAAAFVWRFHADIRQISLPKPLAFTDGVGAASIPDGVRALLGQALLDHGVSPHAASVLVAFAVSLVSVGLVGALFACAAAIAQRPDFEQALRTLPQRARLLLMIAAALFGGCFLASENIGYRAVLIVPALPAIVGLALNAPSRGARWLFAAATAACLCGLWMLTLQALVAFAFGGSAIPVSGALAGYLFWLIRELAWWAAVTVLLAALARHARDLLNSRPGLSRPRSGRRLATASARPRPRRPPGAAPAPVRRNG